MGDPMIVFVLTTTCVDHDGQVASHLASIHASFADADHAAWVAYQNMMDYEDKWTGEIACSGYDTDTFEAWVQLCEIGEKDHDCWRGTPCRCEDNICWERM